MGRIFLEFEKPIQEVVEKLTKLKQDFKGSEEDLEKEVKKLEEKLAKVTRNVYSKLDSWEKVLVARHPQRPYTVDYLELMVDDFLELHGDRNFRDDKSIITGLGKIDGVKFAIIGQEKGRGTREKIFRNFGSAHPEGYRKALRVMKLAEKFALPVLCLIDTQGAYPGIGAEERGQAEAIARNLREMAVLKTPTISVVIGEGGSGGALGIGVTDRILMLENSIYSVISPEGCASILLRDATRAKESAESLKLTAPDVMEFNIVEEIIEEPLGGAHTDPPKTAENIKKAVLKHLAELQKFSLPELLENRYKKFKSIGVYK